MPPERQNNLTVPPIGYGKWGAWLYALTVFFSAWLLFQVQPLMGKYVLPWFGGSPEVWTICMLFFQVLLLLGYAYAHWLTKQFSSRRGVWLHLALLLLVLFVLPITPDQSLRPSGAQNPTTAILTILVISIGAPYFLLSATGPLIQRWYSQSFEGRSPYRLYALSNAGSLLALLSYPLLIEPNFSRKLQTQLWSVGMGVFVFLCIGCGIFLYGRLRRQPPLPEAKPSSPSVAPSWKTTWAWIAFPAAASMELLAVTNKITLDIAAVPFLWVLPLCLYLLSFILTFDSPRWYVRPVFLGGLMLSIIVMTWSRSEEEQLSAVVQIAVYSLGLFFTCMVCHGELYRLRPQPQYLTGYYLKIALGGALGGFLVAVVAPLIFNSYLELYFGLLGCCLFVLLTDRSPGLSQGNRRWLYVGGLVAVGLVAILMPAYRDSEERVVEKNIRNFFGVLTLWREHSEDPSLERRVLQHGTTFHGVQFAAADKRKQATAYYGTSSGVGLAIEELEKRGPLKIGVVGLGAGTLSTYGREDDVIRFYEINPEVQQFAQKYFTYLKDSPARIEILLGDARLTMENETDQYYDLLVLDAFSSDAVPVHLLTKEAFEIYLRHLKPDGVLALHISSRLLDLRPIVFALAGQFQLNGGVVESSEDPDEGLYAATWIILSRENLSKYPLLFTQLEPYRTVSQDNLWTDDRLNLWKAFR